MKYVVMGIVMVVLLAVSQPHVKAQVQAQPLSVTGQPTSYDIRFEPAEITGFGGARFGLSMEEVRSVLRTEFPQADIEENVDPVLKTTVLTLVVPELEPVDGVASPGTATLNYVFGYQSQALIAVHVDWYIQGDATEAQREAMLAAGTAYTAELTSYIWPPLQVVRGHVQGLGTVILFAGRDEHGAGVEVRVEGISLDVMLPEGHNEHWPVTSGPAHLYIGLVAQPDDPDVYRLPENSF